MKISCLVVTQAKRINLLRRCLLSYNQQQIGENSSELIIVHHDGDQCTLSIKELIDEYRIDARIYDVPAQPLGALRNISIEKASGDLLCQWDDDDFYHSDRLAVQSLPFKNEAFMATTLAEQFCWFSNEGDLYVRRGAKEGIHGTIMFRNGLGLKYDSTLRIGEDSKFIEGILSQWPDGIDCINNRPELYVRTYHGKNTWSLEHHYKRLLGQAKNSDWLNDNRELMRGWIEALQLSTVNICDNTGKIIYTL